MKCADIPDDVFMKAVAAVPARPGTCWRNRHDVQAVLEAALGIRIPEKLFLAKARKLGSKRKLEGCTRCTCRGDYHTPRECRRHGCCYDPGFDWRAHPEYDPAWEADEPPARDPDAFPKAAAEATVAALPLGPAFTPFDLSNPSRLVYPRGYVPPASPGPAFTTDSLVIP